MANGTLTIAHLSDIHLAPLPRLPLRHANLKRILGWINWYHSRRGIHRPEVLARLVADIKQHAPDHIAVTGDIANLGLPSEHEMALEWLAGLGPADTVTVVPGNHDIYSTVGKDPGVARWRPHMEQASGQEGCFPFVRRIGEVVLIGVNSAVPTRPFYAIGMVGESQRARLGEILQEYGARGVMRVVLIHHPPLPLRALKRHELTDASALAETLSRHGAELVLHGHNHKAELVLHPGPEGGIPVVGVPSASMARPRRQQPAARYNLYRIHKNGGAPTIEMVSRGIRHLDGPIEEIERRWLRGGD